MEDEKAMPGKPSTNPLASKAGFMANLAKNCQALHALADDEDARAMAQLGRWGKILDAEAARQAAESAD